jgi:hypothetical protein
MTLRTLPPPVLASARVVAYAYVDDVPYKNWGALYAGDTLIEAVPELAIAISLGKDVDPLLFHCDSQWEVLGTSGGPTIDEAKLRAERNYSRVAKRWIDVNTMVDEVQFDQIGTVWEPDHRVVWTYRFTKDSFPPHALDDHVRIGGRYFDVIDTEYVIEATPEGTMLRVVMHYRVSTNFNWYVRPIASFLVLNFEKTALAFYAHRAESRL